MTRSFILFFLACVALAGSLTAVLATSAERDLMMRGVVDAAANTDLPYRVPRLGVNADLTQYAADQLPYHFDLMQQANVTWVRQYVYWDQVEAQQGIYDWADLDTITEAIRPYADLRLVLVIMNSPAWARPNSEAENLTTPPDDPATLATFAAALATRYGDLVDHYQVWDEPNLDDTWGKADPRPADYAALLCQAYPAIHGVDGRATVLMGALAPTTEISGQNIADWRYLDQLYTLDADQCFDAAAAKPYGFNTAPTDRTVRNEVLNFSRLILVREVMVKHGDGRKALWASQWGWNSLPPNWSGQPSIWGQVTQEQQQTYAAEAMARVDREWPWLDGMIAENWQPNAPADSPLWGYAILAPDGTPNALYTTLASLPREAARNGVFHPVTPYARYSGIWTFSTQGADIGWLETSDSQLEFDFTGRDIALWTRQDDYVAFLYPTIDTQPANALPQDNAGNAYVFLRSASLEPEFTVVPLAHALPDAPHTLRIVADRGWDRWALAGYAVSEGNLAQPYQTQIALATLTSVVCALAVLYTAWQIEWAMYRPLALIGRRLTTGQHLALSFITSLALMIGLLLTWGDSVPTLFRRDTLNLGALIVLSGGLLALQPGLILTLITLVILFWLIYQRIEHGLMLTLIFAPYFAFPVELYIYKFPMVEIITLVTAAAWVLRGLADWGRERRRDPAFSLWARVVSRWHALDTWVLAWLVLGVAALLWSERWDRAITEFRTFFIEPALFYAIFRTTIRDVKTLRRCVDVLILSGLVMAIIGLVTYSRCVLTDTCTMVIEAEGGARRLASVYGSPNNVALFLGRCVPFVLAFLLMPVETTDHSKSQVWPRYQKAFYAFALMIMLLTILLTQSVGALILGLPVGIGVVLIVSYGWRAIWPLVGIAGVGAVGITILSQVSDRFTSLFTADRGTNFIRLRLWESTFDILRDHPLTGLGLDQFLYVYRDTYIRPDAVYDRDLSHPHNILLDFWVQLGIGGVLLLIVGQFLFWRTCLRLLALWRTSDAVTQALIIGAMAAMAALLAHGLIDNSVYVLDLVYVFMLLWAIPAVLETMQQDP